jgi:hypothetical protein
MCFIPVARIQGSPANFGLSGVAGVVLVKALIDHGPTVAASSQGQPIHGYVL